MKNKQAFTLVELIVVVTILAILSTIGFVSYSGYLAGVRDTNRIAQLKAIGDALHLYSTNKSLPTPDDKIDIKTNTKTIGYQGYVGKDTIETVGYTAEGLDPKDKTYFSYYLTKDKKYFQLMAFLEEEQGLTSKIKLNNQTQAEIDYETRYPIVEGSKLGILTGTGGAPLQELITGEIDLVTQSTGVTSILSNSETQTGTTLQGIASDASCKRLYEVGGKRISGVYKIDPNGDGTGFRVYCDMETDGGGWTLVLKSYNGDNKNFYNTDINKILENDVELNISNYNLDKNDYKGNGYISIKGEKLLAVDLSNNNSFVSGYINNGTKTLKEHILNAQDGRWEGGANGCGIILDDIKKSTTDVVIGNILIEHFGLMCTDDEKTAWTSHGDDSVYFGFLPRAANGNGQRTHHSGIGKWANDGGDDIYESSNGEYSSDSGIAILIK